MVYQYHFCPPGRNESSVPWIGKLWFSRVHVKGMIRWSQRSHTSVPLELKTDCQWYYDPVMNLRSKYSRRDRQIISYDLSLWSTFFPGILCHGIVYENGIKITPTIESDIFDTLNISKQLLIAGFALVGTLCVMETTNSWPLPPPWWATAQRFCSCVYLATIGIYVFCVWSRKATKYYPCRCLGGKKFSSSGRAGGIEVKWNRRRSYLVSSNFGFGFCLVLI